MTITPSTLTREMVDSLLESAHPNGEAPDPNHPPDRALARAIAVWRRWDSDGRDRNEYNARRAAREICDVINMRDEAKAHVGERPPESEEGER